MEYLVKRPSFIQESLKYLEGTVIKLMTLKPRDFLLMKTYIPSIPEQTKIAELFTTLDEYIVMETKKIDAYKALKKSMLQKMFPANNATNPELRFPQFNSDWKSCKLSDVAKRYDNLRVPVAADLRVAGTTPYYGANGIQDYVEGFTHEGEFVLIAEDGASDLKNYPVNYVNGKIWVNNHAHVVQGIDNVCDNRFLSYLIVRTDIESLLVGGGRSKLNADVMMKIKLKLPEYQEQKLLGNYFANLDDLISLHQRKLEQINLYKHCLQQRMFV
jgi:type I restriction enzyme S subunit